MNIYYLLPLLMHSGVDYDNTYFIKMKNKFKIYAGELLW